MLFFFFVTKKQHMRTAVAELDISPCEQYMSVYNAGVAGLNQVYFKSEVIHSLIHVEY